MAAVYTILQQDRTDQSKRVHDVQIAYTAEAYSSGLAVDLPSVGMRQVIESLVVYDLGGAGVVAQFNGGKIRLFQSPAVAATPAAAAALAEVSGAQTITLKARIVGF